MTDGKSPGVSGSRAIGETAVTVCMHHTTRLRFLRFGLRRKHRHRVFLAVLTYLVVDARHFGPGDGGQQ